LGQGFRNSLTERLRLRISHEASVKMLAKTEGLTEAEEPTSNVQGYLHYYTLVLTVVGSNPWYFPTRASPRAARVTSWHDWRLPPE